MNKKIAIIGAGHMGKALIKGLENSGFEKDKILISDNAEENRTVAAQADWIIVAVKPTIVSQVIEDIKDVVINKLLISVAAVVTIDSLQQYSENNDQKIIRLMPNIAVAYGQGVIGFYSNDNVSDEEKNDVRVLLSGLGTVISCKKEKDLDAITILSGSGPAVVAYWLLLFEQVGKEFGFEKEDSQKIAYQTFIGTLKVLQETNKTAEELQNAVATKGGITEHIIQSLDQEEVRSKFQRSFETGYARIKKIGEGLK